MNKIKNFLKTFTPYQIVYISVVYVITLLFTILMPENMLEDTNDKFVVTCSVIAVLANPMCELFISKQSKYNFVIDALFIELPEFVLCIALGWYTIAIVTMVFWVPIDIVSFISWSKHPDKKEEELTMVKRLSFKQDIFVVLAIAAFGFGVGYLIKLIPGAADSYLDAFSAAFGMANGILLLLRYEEQWYAWFVTLVLYAVMYIVSHSYIMLITVAAMFVNTCYGFIKWYLYTKTNQKIQPEVQQNDI